MVLLGLTQLKGQLHPNCAIYDFDISVILAYCKEVLDCMKGFAGQHYPNRGYFDPAFRPCLSALMNIAPRDTFRAIGAVMDMETSLDVNLVDVNTCRPSILEIIKEQGVDLGLKVLLF